MATTEQSVPVPVDPNQASSSLEHLLEHVVLAELAQEAWFGRQQLVDILHTSVDAFGYDVALECGGVLRHVQFKSRRLDAKTATYAINTRLAERPSGCVVWLGWRKQPEQNRVEIEYRWFGGLPGERLTGLGAVMAKHSKANAAGTKLERPGLRVVNLGKFVPLRGAGELLDRLFGPAERRGVRGAAP